MPDDQSGTTDDKEWQRWVAGTLVTQLAMLDNAVFYYPRELKAAGRLRAALAEAAAEARIHMGGPASAE